MSSTRGRKLLQLIETRQQNDANLSSIDRSKWYTVNLDALPSEELCSKFQRLEFDSATEQFLDDSHAIADSVCLQLWYSVATAILGILLTKTSINGILNRGQMFIFSDYHLAAFLEPILADYQAKYAKNNLSLIQRTALLDLGAGDGEVTSALAATRFKKVFVTEPSVPMQYRLRQRGYSILEIDKWATDQSILAECRLISCLNLLDRHPKPHHLLSELHKAALQHDIPVLLAFVLPFSQFSEFSKGLDETLAVLGPDFEHQIVDIVERVLEPVGFRLIRWTKLPYLCQGDATQAYYWLNDAVLLLRAV